MCKKRILKNSYIKYNKINFGELKSIQTNTWRSPTLYLTHNFQEKYIIVKL